jgi:hypothetical protein
MLVIVQLFLFGAVSGFGGGDVIARSGDDQNEPSEAIDSKNIEESLAQCFKLLQVKRPASKYSEQEKFEPLVKDMDDFMRRVDSAFLALLSGKPVSDPECQVAELMAFLGD